ncbi:MAG: DUF4870 domain-containing protein [Anaerolineales bacterium]|nr:DUF4870 domain-containing protein [Anaerolineales bacterium]
MQEAPAAQPVDQNDRIMAALAHISAVLPLMGVIAAISIWATQRERSKYVSFQALQAVVYQLCMILLYFIGMALYMASFVFMFLLLFLAGNAGSGAAPGELSGLVAIVPMLVLALIMVVGFAFIVYGLVGGVAALQGKDFRYVVIGRALERYLEKGQLGS